MLLNFLLVIEFIVSLALIGVVLLQRSEGGALGMGGGPSGLMTARGAGDLLTRTTWILATVFFVLAMTLTILSGRERGASSVVDRLKAIDTSTVPAAPPTPAAPAGQATPTQPAPLQAPAPQVNNPFLGGPAPAAAPAPAATPATPPAKR